MRTCQQIYHEAADYLYSRGRVGIEIEGDSVRVLGQSFKPALEALPCPVALTYARRLDFRIVLSLRPGLDLHEVCLAHRTTAYLTRLIKQSQLHEVSILLEVHLQAGSLMCEKQDLDVQLSQHRPGDITWPHIAVFVMDPLREIHLRAGGRVFFKPPTYTPQIFELLAFQHLRADLTEAMVEAREQGPRSELSGKYSIFVPYLEALQTLRDLKQTILNQYYFDARRIAYAEIMLYSEEVLYNIRCAVVRSDIGALRVHHNEYVRRLLLLLQSPGACQPEYASFGSSFQPLSGDLAVALSSALTMLAVVFPQNMATFDLGAVHVERAILRWQMDGESRGENPESEKSRTSEKRS